MSANSILLSTVIVTFNNESEITQCLLSLAGEFDNFRGEVIVVDNESQDRTLELLTTAKSAWGDRLRIIRNAGNVGFTRALNQGLAVAKGEYVLILNPDVTLKNNGLLKLIGFLERTESAGVVAPKLLNGDDTVQPSCRRFPKHRDIVFEVSGLSRIFSESRMFNGWKMGDFDHNRCTSVEQPQGAFLLCARRLLIRTGLWDERFPMFFSDVDWCHRVKQAGYEIWYFPEVQAYHEKGVSIYQRRLAMILTSHKSFYRYLKKYYTGSRFFLANELVGCILAIAAVLRFTAALIFPKRRV